MIKVAAKRPDERRAKSTSEVQKHTECFEVESCSQQLASKAGLVELAEGTGMESENRASNDAGQGEDLDAARHQLRGRQDSAANVRVSQPRDLPDIC